MVLPQRFNPRGQGSYFEFYGEQVRTQHIRRKSWLWTVDGIAILHDLINTGKIKRIESLNYIPGVGIEIKDGVRIILSDLRYNMLPNGGLLRWQR